jgi:hypothetical protein
VYLLDLSGTDKELPDGVPGLLAFALLFLFAFVLARHGVDERPFALGPGKLPTPPLCVLAVLDGFYGLLLLSDGEVLLGGRDRLGVAPLPLPPMLIT